MSKIEKEITTKEILETLYGVKIDDIPAEELESLLNSIKKAEKKNDFEDTMIMEER